MGDEDDLVKFELVGGVEAGSRAVRMSDWVVDQNMRSSCGIGLE